MCARCRLSNFCFRYLEYPFRMALVGFFFLSLQFERRDYARCTHNPLFSVSLAAFLHEKDCSDCIFCIWVLIGLLFLSLFVSAFYMVTKVVSYHFWRFLARVFMSHMPRVTVTASLYDGTKTHRTASCGLSGAVRRWIRLPA